MNSRNKGLIITGILVFLCGIGALLVGGWLSGWDFVAFFKSPTFMWIVVLMGAYLVVALVILAKDWVRNKL